MEQKMANIKKHGSFVDQNGDVRRSGATTRIIDNAIQTLFTEGKVTVVDPYPSEAAQENAFIRTVDRLRIEHGLFDFNIDKDTRTISLKK